ncbi:glycoside hydrolase family 43 protein [Catenovulum sp. SX2]|uniref:glycoside hydrolase family 43 protein n=1 Tax=Catenovulum sp. SX2 TaxID=3398614 RepID=UPI003F846AD7
MVKKFNIIKHSLVALGITWLTSACSVQQDSTTNTTATVEEAQAWVFSSFRKNGQDGLHLAYSEDGKNWHALNQDKSILAPTVGGKLMRDPCIIKGPDGQFHMVWTSSWEDGGIGVAHSADLINWSEQVFVPTMQKYPTAKNAWAPEIIWDPATEQYVIFWASTIPGSYPETEKQADKGWDHRMYAVTTKNFKEYSEPFLLVQPDFNIIDSSIIAYQDHYVMILKDETRYPPAKNLRVATSKNILGPWQVEDKAFTPEGVWVEGPSMFKKDDWYYVIYDEYTNKKYGMMRTQDFNKWQLVSEQLNMPKGSRHGTVLPVSQAELNKLKQHFAAQ